MSTAKKLRQVDEATVDEAQDLLSEVIKFRDEVLGNSEGLDFSILETEFASSDLEDVADHINLYRSEILDSLRNVSVNIIKTVKSMTESSTSLDKVHSESNQLAEYSSTIASAAEELSATINSISQNIQNTIEASGEAKTLALSGNSMIKNTVDTIENVSEVLCQTTSSLTKLRETAEEANTIIKVVNDISAKTDLLALNASIEAARAGTAGKGFAVVAHEVGRLSEKTQASINEIETILKNIQKDVDTVSSNLNVGTKSATEAVGKANEASDKINDVVQQIEKLDNEVSNIGSAINEQGEAVRDIAENVSTISLSSKQVNDKVVEVSESVNAVTVISNGTRNLLGQFKLGGRSVLLQSQVDHLFWMHRLRRMLCGQENIQQEEFVDHTKCRLGKWYQSVEKKGKTTSFIDFYDQLDAPHAKLHSIAANVIKNYNQGDTETATKLYEECLPISVTIVSLLESMLSEVED
jgi:methyl-accepting chemotaxis protein